MQGKQDDRSDQPQLARVQWHLQGHIDWHWELNTLNSKEKIPEKVLQSCNFIHIHILMEVLKMGGIKLEMVT